MTGTQANARIWSSVNIYVGDVGTTAPTDVATPLDAGYALIGYIDEDDGVQFMQERTVTDHRAYGGSLLRSGVKGEKFSFKFSALENNPNVHGLLNPKGTIATTGGVSTVSLGGHTPNQKAFLVESTDGDIIERKAYPLGEVIEAPGEQSYTDDGIRKLPLVVTLYDDDEGFHGVLVSNDPALAA